MNDIQANRSFLYGDGFFETMRVSNNRIPLIVHHLNRAKRVAKIFQLRWKPEWDEDFFNAVAASIPNDCVFRATFYRDNGGTYQSTSNNIKVHFQNRPIPENNSLFVQQALKQDELLSELRKLPTHDLGIYDQILKPRNVLSNIKSTSSLYYVLAGLYLQTSTHSDILILNDANRACEGLTSNLLLFTSGEWYTPMLTEGPVDGTYLAFLRTFLPINDSELELKDVKEAEEVFLVNASLGFRRMKFNFY